MPRTLLSSFEAGEISERYQGRVNLAAYQNSCQKIKNMVVGELGGVFKRPPLLKSGSVSAATTFDKIIPFGDQGEDITFAVGLSAGRTVVFKAEAGTLTEVNSYAQGHSSFIPVGTHLTFLDDSFYGVVNSNITQYTIDTAGVLTNAKTISTGTAVSVLTTDGSGKASSSKKKDEYFFLVAETRYTKDDHIYPNKKTDKGAAIQRSFSDFENGYSVLTQDTEYTKYGSTNNMVVHKRHLFLCQAIVDIPKNAPLLVPAINMTRERPVGKYGDDKFDTTAAGDSRYQEYIDAVDVGLNSAYVNEITKEGLDLLGAHDVTTDVLVAAETTFEFEKGATSANRFMISLPDTATKVPDIQNNLSVVPGIYNLQGYLYPNSNKGHGDYGAYGGFNYELYVSCSASDGYGPSGSYKKLSEYSEAAHGAVDAVYVEIHGGSSWSGLNSKWEFEEGLAVKVRFRWTNNKTESVSGQTFSFQNRLGKFDKNKIQMSQVGEYENFTVGSEADSPIEYDLKADHQIHYVVDGPVMMVGSNKGEYVIGAENGVISGDASKVSINKKSQYGTTGIHHITQNAMLFMSKNRMRRMQYDMNSDSFFAGDESILAEHLFRGGIKEIISVSEPQSILFFLTPTGKVFGCSYDVTLGNKAFFNVDFHATIDSMVAINGRVFFTHNNELSGQTEVSSLNFEETGDLYVDCKSDCSEIRTNRGAQIPTLYGVRLFHLDDGVREYIHSETNDIPQTGYLAYPMEVEIETSNFVAQVDAALSQGTIKRIGSLDFRCEKATDFSVGQDSQMLVSAITDGRARVNEDVPVVIGGTYSKEGRVVIKSDSVDDLRIGGVFGNVEFYGGLE